MASHDRHRRSSIAERGERRRGPRPLARRTARASRKSIRCRRKRSRSPTLRRRRRFRRSCSPASCAWPNSRSSSWSAWRSSPPICRSVDGLFWRYLGAIFAIARAVDARVPDRRHLSGAGLPRPREAIHAARLGLVGGVPDRHRRVVLRQSRRHVLARLARQLLRQRARRARDLAQHPVPTGAQMDARRPPHPAHGDRRRRRIRRARDRGIAPAEGFRRQDHRPVRRSRRRPQQLRLRRRAQARHRRRSGRIRPAHARRSGDLLAADLGGRPHPADAEEIVGAAGRHPARRPHQQAAIPPALLFLHRQGAGARRVRSADRRLGRGDEMAVRQDRRRPVAPRRAAADGDDRDRHQARQPRAGARSSRSATASTTT